MNEKELNKKLAEWAGFTWHENKELVYGAMMHGSHYELGHWDYQGECWYSSLKLKESNFQFNKEGLPDFTQSLDTCFKWLVPKLREFGLLDLSLTYSYLELKMGGDDTDKLGFQCRLRLEKFLTEPFRSQGKTPALALCLAIEKLIDVEKQK